MIGVIVPTTLGESAWPVRHFMTQNARHWAAIYHVDGLRLDAIQAIKDDDQPHIVQMLATGAREVAKNRSFLVIAEDEFNRPRLVQSADGQPVEMRGYGLDAIYADHFSHYQLHVAITGERSGYYKDYQGNMRQLVATINNGWWFTGQVSKWRKRKVGESAHDVPPQRLIWCLQNHDQIGNRPSGERLNNRLVEPAVYRAASALLLLSPYTPLLFMGQEWGASTPFPFFTDHVAKIGDSVIRGRRNLLRKLFDDFDPGTMLGPQDESTFLSAKLKWEERSRQPHDGYLQLYTDLLRLRREHSALRARDRNSFRASRIDDRALMLSRNAPASANVLLVIINLRGQLVVDLRKEPIPSPGVGCRWVPLFDTEHPQYGGSGEARLSGWKLDVRQPSAVILRLTSAQ